MAGAVTRHRYRSRHQPTYRSDQLLVRGPGKRQRQGRCDAPTPPPNPPLREQSLGESPHHCLRSLLYSPRQEPAPAAAGRGSRLWRSDTAVHSPPRGALKPGVCEGMVGHLTVCVSSRYQPQAAACSRRATTSLSAVRRGRNKASRRCQSCVRGGRLGAATARLARNRLLLCDNVAQPGSRAGRIYERSRGNAFRGRLF